MYVVYKWERVVDIVLVIMVVVVVGEKWGGSFFLARSLVRLISFVFISTCIRTAFIVTIRIAFVWLTFPLSCVHTFDGIRCVSFGVLQMNGNKSAEAYFNTCNRDISSNGCACGDGMWHAINAFVQRAQSTHKRRQEKKGKKINEHHYILLLWWTICIVISFGFDSSWIEKWKRTSHRDLL